MKERRFLKISKFIFLFFAMLYTSSNIFSDNVQILGNGDVKIKGLIVAYWDTDGTDEKEIEFYLVPKDMKKFSGKAVSLYFLDDFAMETPKFRENKAREIFTDIPSKFREKEGSLERNVIVTLEPIRPVESGHTVKFFSKVKKIEKINGAASVFKEGEPDKLFDLIQKEVSYYYIHSKEGYSNLREKPDIKSKVKKRLENGVKIMKIMDTGDWAYIYDQNAYTGEEEEYRKIKGYIHKSQIKK